MDSHPDFASSYSAPAAKIDEDSNIANRNFATTYMEPTFPPVVALSDGQSVMVPQPQRDPTSGSQHATLPTDLPNMMSSALAQPNPSAFSFIPPAAPLQKSAMSNVNPLTLRQAYSMPPAGLVGPGRHYDPSLNSASTRGEYKMASDIFGTGMSGSWSGGTPSTENSNQTRATEPSSFKITEFIGNGSSAVSNQPDQAANNVAATTRRARESSGNPLTGQGYEDANGIRTAKRYFEGSNSNQKLW